MSEAKCETGWGDGFSVSNSARVERSPHPAAPCGRVDPPPPGEGKKVVAAQYAVITGLDPVIHLQECFLEA
jgi:hypothetical protein